MHLNISSEYSLFTLRHLLHIRHRPDEVVDECLAHGAIVQRSGWMVKRNDDELSLVQTHFARLAMVAANA